MPIKVECRLSQGWKAYENKRFGEVLEIVFINTENNTIIFRYAPKLEDKAVFEEYFKLLDELDLSYKKLKEIITRIEQSKKIMS